MKRPPLSQLAAGLVGLGALLRLRQFAANRPLWLDEAMLALNIVGRSLGGLLRPLTDDQSAPVPFLWGTRLVTLVGGVHEATLRLLPLLAGLLLLPLMWRLARRLLSPEASLLALALVVFSPLLIYYSNEVKPYGLDACLAALVAATTASVLADPGSTAAWRRLLLSGSLAALASTTAFLVFAGAGAALVLSPLVRSTALGRRYLLACLLAWAGLFGTMYVAFLRSSASNAYLQAYWATNFLSPWEPGFTDRILNAVGSTLGDTFLGSGGGWRTRVALLLLVPASAGAVALGRIRGPGVPLVLAGPFLAALGASALHRYPFAPRLMLFSAPLLAVLIAAGLEAACRRLVVRGTSAALLALSSLLLLLPVRTGLRDAAHPEAPEDIRSLVAVFHRQHREGDAIYVFGRSIPGWLFYSTDWKHPDLGRVTELSELVGSTGVAFRNAPSRGRAVIQEGDSLRFGGADFQELVGIPAGTGPAPGLPGGQDQPDEGWAPNEIRRLRSAAGPASGWVLLTSFKPAVAEAMTRAANADGAALLGRWESPRGVLLRYTFDGK